MNENKHTLEEIALAICHYYCEKNEGCGEDCIGFDLCSKNNNGALAFLRKVVNE